MSARANFDGVNGGRGQKWIWNATRCAIYFRDAGRCVYCNVLPSRLMLDHVTPRCDGGENSPGNLVTVCNACNERKGDRSLDSYALLIEAQDGFDEAETIRRRVALAVAKPLDRAMGKQLEAERARGSFSSTWFADAARAALAEAS